MEKKVTLLDIAREAGVSVATVSYVINNRTDLKVREETRKKVLQICNLRQYTPSQIAKSLATGKNNIIGIQFRLLHNSPGRNLEMFELIKELQITLQASNYDTLIMPELTSSELRIQRNIDGIICIDLLEKEFYNLKENYFKPIVPVDMIVADSLFFRIGNDVNKIVELGKKAFNTNKINYITEHRLNDYVHESLIKADPSLDIYTIKNINDFIAHLKANENEYYIFDNPLLLGYCLPIINPENIAVICSDNYIAPLGIKKIVISAKEKAAAAKEMLFNAIERKEDMPHEFLILPQIS